jgi:hypothetical protein
VEGRGQEEGPHRNDVELSSMSSYDDLRRLGAHAEIPFQFERVDPSVRGDRKNSLGRPETGRTHTHTSKTLLRTGSPDRERPLYL